MKIGKNSGVPLTAAPEVLAGKSNTYASDVYSAGITIALLLEITDIRWINFAALGQSLPVATVTAEECLTQIQKILASTEEQAEEIYQMIQTMTLKEPAMRCGARDALQQFSQTFNLSGYTENATASCML